MDKGKALQALLTALAVSLASRADAQVASTASVASLNTITQWLHKLQPTPNDGYLKKIQDDDYSEFFVDQPSGPFGEDNFTEITPDFGDMVTPDSGGDGGFGGDSGGDGGDSGGDGGFGGDSGSLEPAHANAPVSIADTYNRIKNTLQG